MTDSATTPNAPTAGDTALSAQLDKLLELAHREGVNRFPPKWADEKWYERTMSQTDEYRAAIAEFTAALLAARREVRALRDAAKDCADELEAEVRNRYGYPDVHPAMQWRYERDMESVETARAALAATQEGKRND